MLHCSKKDSGVQSCGIDITKLKFLDDLRFMAQLYVSASVEGAHSRCQGWLIPIRGLLMLSRRFTHFIHILLLLFIAGGSSSSYGASRILVVMSYEENFSWSQEVKRGIDMVLAADNEIHYFYMNTKTDFKGGGSKSAGGL